MVHAWTAALIGFGTLLGCVGAYPAVPEQLSKIPGPRGRYDKVLPRFLFITAPASHNVLWMPLPSFNDLVKNEPKDVNSTNVLIDGVKSKCEGVSCDEDSDMGLSEPTGIAMFHGKQTVTEKTDTGEVTREKAISKLYVSDVRAMNIYVYDIEGGLGPIDFWMKVGPQKKVVEGVAGGATWLAIDGVGNLFYSTGHGGEIQMVTAEELTKPKPASKMLYDASKDTVSNPAGLAVDNYWLYWANQEGGAASGTVARGYEQQPKAAETSQVYPQALAKNADKAYGVCLARNNLFYTGETKSLFAVKTTGGLIAEVSAGFKSPRGCVYDSMSTLYVADIEANAIYSLPANFENLRSVKHLNQFVAVDGPAQLVIYSASESHAAGVASRALFATLLASIVALMAA